MQLDKKTAKKEKENHEQEASMIVMGNAIKMFHVVFVTYLWAIPIFFRKNIKVLIIHVAVCIAVLLQWYMYGACILNEIENYYTGDQTMNEDDNRPKSFLNTLIEDTLHVTEQSARMISTINLVLLSYVSLYFIYIGKCQ